VTADAGPKPGATPRTLHGTVLVGVARVLAALPEAPLIAAAESLGELWYRVAPDKAAQARANLRRVCIGLDAQGRGTRAARRAATEPEALERLVRAAFRHAARYYLEVARTGAYDLDTAVSKIAVESPTEAREGLMSGRPAVLVGMHYGALELPGIYIAHLTGRGIVAPMETVADPELQRWFMTSRGRVGVTIIPLKDARRPLLAALRRGDSIGLINDRDITGSGIPVNFFGHPAPISPGAALLALETGTAVYVGSARRLKGGRYGGKLIEVPLPDTGTRRQRLVALTEAITGAFETILADGPEQWWGAFHPIWPDLVVGKPGDGGPGSVVPAGSGDGHAAPAAEPGAAAEPAAATEPAAAAEVDTDAAGAGGDAE
jgi:phosphatidylinositol dimannoside acyltransferase